MSNISPFPAQRQHDAGHAPQPDPVAPIARLVHAIDKAVGQNWSFDLVHHEVVGDETVVFAKLVVDGRSRVGVGGTGEKGTLVDRLTSATVDALYRAATWMGIAVQDDDKPVSAAAQANDDVSHDTAETTPQRLSRKQLDFIYSLARQQGIARDQVAARCLDDFGRKPEYLSKQQASDIIKALQGQGGSR
jgi:hypothetical protein